MYFNELNLVYILGNINGDTDDLGGPIIDIFDILELLRMIIIDIILCCFIFTWLL